MSLLSQMVIAVGPERMDYRVLRGHEVGGDRMFEVVEHLMKLGVRYVTVWGFSTDNWKKKRRRSIQPVQIA